MHLKDILAFLAISSAAHGSDLLEMAKDAFSSDLEASKHCGHNLHNCHIINVVLGIMCLGLLIINISTIVFFNREALRYACGRMAARFHPAPEDSQPIVHHDEDDPYFH